MKRRRMNRPVVCCLVLALLLAAAQRFGFDQSVKSLLCRVGSSQSFASHAVSWELGLAPVPVMHAPHILNSGITEEEPASVPEDESDVSECAFTPEAAPAVHDFSAAEVTVKTTANLSYDIPAMLKNPITIRKSTGPQVLIYHTHATEAYTKDPENQYPSGDNFRTTDTKYNVVRVGDELTKILESNGIEVIHCRKLFDSPTYNGSYGRSLTEIQQTLKEHPSIQLVIDVHRDAILTSTGSYYATSCEKDGKKMAQVMLVVGSNGTGLTHDNWQKNLNYAVNLQSRLLTEQPGLMRTIDLRAQRFNQQYRTGSFLLEVGSNGNTLPEAIAAVQRFGETLAKDLNGV